MRDNEKRKVAVACKYNWFQYGWRIEVCLQPHTVKSRILAHLVLEAHTGFFRFSMMGNGNFLEKVDFLIHMLVLATLLYCFFLVHLEVIPIDL